jgi:hypothetical protein
MLTKDAILASNDLKVEKVHVPEWGGYVYVRNMGATDRERYLESLHVTVGKGKESRREIRVIEASAKLATLTICDKNGNRIFSDADVKVLGQKSSAALERCTDAAAKLNGIDDDAKDEAKND